MKVLNPSVAIKLSADVALSFGIDPKKDRVEAKFETVGVWNIIKSFEALCICNIYDENSIFTKILSTEIIGKRKLSNPRQSGYHMEGYVSVKGKKYSAYSSDMLIDVDGHLINVETINLRNYN